MKSDEDTFRADVQMAGAGVEVHVATRFGPRVVWFGRPGGSNLFAELGDLSIGYGEGRRFHLRGGHRLWVGPELPELTYQPDSQRVGVSTTDGGITVTGPPDDFGLVKTIRLELIAGQAAVIVDHTVEATAPTTLDVAPWAITQLRPGGVAVMPLGLPGGPVSNLQASHQIVMWPYTDPDDPALMLGGRHVTVTSAVRAPTKIGTALERGWLAYLVDDDVFVKRTPVVSGDRHVDLGATGQIYAAEEFVELETLGPICALAAGDRMRHREVWELHARPPGTPLEAIELLALDG